MSVRGHKLCTHKGIYEHWGVKWVCRDTVTSESPSVLRALSTCFRSTQVLFTAPCFHFFNDHTHWYCSALRLATLMLSIIDCVNAVKTIKVTMRSSSLAAHGINQHKQSLLLISYWCFSIDEYQKHVLMLSLQQCYWWVLNMCTYMAKSFFFICDHDYITSICTFPELLPWSWKHTII